MAEPQNHDIGGMKLIAEYGQALILSNAMLCTVIALGLFLIALERLVPDQKLPSSPGWFKRVVIINVFQLAIVVLGIFTWDHWFEGMTIFALGGLLHPAVSGLIAYVVITFVFYWWHRVRHDSDLAWRLFHQVHHSAARIETITSFYKHPLEIVVNSILIAAVNHLLLGVGIEGAKWNLLYTAAAEYFYHMNIRTPYWVGFFFQRPEMHRLHHRRGWHYNNFADLPIWDMIFGTFFNPKTYRGQCGFEPAEEQDLGSMLAFRDLSKGGHHA